MTGSSVPDDLLPPWEHLETRFVAEGVPGLVVVRERPAVTLFVDANARAFGAYFETDHAGLTAPLASVHCREAFIDGRRHVELSVSDPALFRTFYSLLAELIGEVVVAGRPFGVAAADTLARWRALIQQVSLMSDERQSGLFGELWLLERLVRSRGPGAVRAWTGPTSAAHDFRVASGDLEVKTTYGERRVHVVNGLGQLTPAGDIPLHLLSLRLQAGGDGGRTLPEAIGAVETLLIDQPAAQAEFRTGLGRAGYREEDASHYRAKRRLAAPAVIARVEDGFPRLTAEALASLSPAFAPDRFRSVTYRIDVEGLGWPDGSPEFLAVIPEGAPRPTGAP